MSDSPVVPRPRIRRAAPAPGPFAQMMLRPHVAWPILCAVLAFELDFLLVPRVPGIGDAAEFTLALALGGVPHPTGYPLYTLFGATFVRALHGLGIDAVRAAGLWSALGAALAIGLFAGLVESLISPAVSSVRRAWLRALPVLALALHPVWLRAATEPEVYSWWFACVAGAAWFCVHTLAMLERVPVRNARTGFVWGVLAGAAFLQHALSLLFIAPLTLALLSVLQQRRALRASFVPAFVAGVALPLASWGFIAWRAFHPAAYQWPLEPNLASVWAHVRGAAYTTYLGGFAPNPAERALLARTLMPIIIPGLALGAFVALREARPAARAVLLSLVLGGALLLAFTLNYRVPDPALYGVPVLMVALLALPALCARLPRVLLALLTLALAGAMTYWGVTASLQRRAQLERIDVRIRAAWRAVPFEHGIVLWNDDHSARLVLMQLLEHDHTERIVADPDRLTWPAARAEFTRRAGFDPLAGLSLATTADLQRIPPNIEAHATLPVIEFSTLLGHEPAPR